MRDTIEELDISLIEGSYTVREACGLTGVSQKAIGQLLKWYPAKIPVVEAPWEKKLERESLQVSFLELIEILMAGKIRAGNKQAYGKVREYHDGLAAEWRTQFPFAHQNLLTYKERLPAPAVKTLGQLDYENEFVSRWCPLGKDQPIAVDPRRGSGVPTIKGRRLRVQDIKGYFAGGDSVSFLAADFELEQFEVEAALRYALLTAR